MYYIVKKNVYGDYLFWSSKRKNFSYSGGSAYASLDSAKKAASIISHNYKIGIQEIEIASHEAIVNHYQTVTSI